MKEEPGSFGSFASVCPRHPSGVQAGHGSCLRVPPSAGRPDALVSGQLADSCIILGGSLLDEGQGCCFVSGFWSILRSHC